MPCRTYGILQTKCTDTFGGLSRPRGYPVFATPASWLLRGPLDENHQDLFMGFGASLRHRPPGCAKVEVSRPRGYLPFATPASWLLRGPLDENHQDLLMRFAASLRHRPTGFAKVELSRPKGVPPLLLHLLLGFSGNLLMKSTRTCE